MWKGIEDNMEATKKTATTLAEEVDAAREALLRAAQEEPARWWSARDLRDRAQNGWTPSAVMIALNRLVAEGRLERDDHLRVRLVT